MDIRIEIINYKQAKLVSEYMLPYLREMISDDHTYYAAIVNDEFAGLLVADTVVAAPQILSIGVSAKYKGQGIGTRLVEYAVGDILNDYDEEELALPGSISAFIAGRDDDYAALQKIFENLGFSKEDTGSYYAVNIGELNKSELLISGKMSQKVKSVIDSGRLVSLKDAPDRMLNNFGNHLAGSDIFPGIRTHELDKNLTWFGVKDGEIVSCILFLKENNGIFLNTFLYENGNKVSPESMIYLLSASAMTAYFDIPHDKKVMFWIGEEKTKKLLEKLIPDAEVRDEGIRYTLTFEDHVRLRKEHFESAGMEFVENSALVCRNCRHCTNDVLKCRVYSQKPSGVLDGKDCPDFETPA
ncbi:MAG: GNAT family N-acetyltransferase [Lachnospiraceae bacterium]|nr:GNAT family N-acetyltransferase [Lachnospiraceae bacterium]